MANLPASSPVPTFGEYLQKFTHSTLFGHSISEEIRRLPIAGHCLLYSLSDVSSSLINSGIPVSDITDKRCLDVSLETPRPKLITDLDHILQDGHVYIVIPPEDVAQFKYVSAEFMNIHASFKTPDMIHYHLHGCYPQSDGDDDVPRADDPRVFREVCPWKNCTVQVLVEPYLEEVIGNRCILILLNGQAEIDAAGIQIGRNVFTKHGVVILEQDGSLREIDDLQYKLEPGVVYFCKQMIKSVTDDQIAYLIAEKPYAQAYKEQFGVDPPQSE